MQLTPEQIAALDLFRATHGQQWKERLRRCWESGMYPFAGGRFQQLRNTLGPLWLIAYQPGDTQVGVLEYMPERLASNGAVNWRILHYLDAGLHPILVGRGNQKEARAAARQHSITLMEDV